MLISDFAKRTPLNDLDKNSIPKGWKSQDSKETESVIQFYLNLIQNGSLNDKKRLVRENPSLIENIFTLFSDRELGRLYVQTYADSKDRHHTAYFISERLGEPIIRRPPVVLLDSDYQR